MLSAYDSYFYNVDISNSIDFLRWKIGAKYTDEKKKKTEHILRIYQFTVFQDASLLSFLLTTSLDVKEKLTLFMLLDDFRDVIRTLEPLFTVVTVWET